MPNFSVSVTRSQAQTVSFIVTADNKADLEKQLEELDFSELDSRFDEGEVEYIEYDVNKIRPTKDNPTSFEDEELQELLT